MTIVCVCVCVYVCVCVFFPYLLGSQAHFEGSCCYCLVTKLCLTLCNPLDCSMPGFPVLHHLPELAQTHVHWVGDAIQPSCPRSSLSSPAFYLSQHQGLLQWVGSSHHVARVLEFQLQHQSLNFEPVTTIWKQGRFNKMAGTILTAGGH